MVLQGPLVTSLRNILKSSVYEGFTLLAIAINCVTLTLANPKLTDEDQAEYLITLSWVFNVIYVGDLILQLIAFGFKEYLHNPWHYLDFIVGAVSLFELSLNLITAVGLALGLGRFAPSQGFRTFLDMVQNLRTLRPLKAFIYFPSVMAYLLACAKSIYSVLIIVFFLGFTMATISIFSHYIMDDKLQYRCVPTDLSDPNVLNDPFFQDYGTAIFYTKYNTQYCGVRQCMTGFSCVDTKLAFETVPASYATPWHSFVTNLSFLTLRDWPNIFWAILDVGGTWRAAIILGAIFFFGNVLILNLFAAVFIGKLRVEEDRAQKLSWLAYYPGNLDTVTELELLIWASENKKHIEQSLNRDMDVPIPTRIYRVIWKAINPVSYEIAMIQVRKDFHAAIQNDATFLEPGVNVGEVPWRPFVLRGRAWDIIRSYIIPDTCMFNMFSIGMVVFNILLLSMDSEGQSDIVTQFQFWGDIACNATFAFELVAKLVLLGPVLYSDSLFNIVDFFLVILGLAKYVVQVPGFVSNLRVIKLLRLLRLYRVAKLIEVNRDVKAFRDATITIGRLAGLVVDMSAAMFNTMIVSLLLLYILSLFGMKFFVNGPECYSQGLSIGCGLEPLDPTAPAVIPFDISLSWGGKYTDRMNFDSFNNAFATVSNIMFLNNWYNVMLKFILQFGNSWDAWYFIACIFSLNYFSSAMLIASATNVLESHALHQLEEEADANRNILFRVVRIRRKLSMLTFFKRWTKSVFESDGVNRRFRTAGVIANQNLKDDAQEKIPPRFWLQRFVIARQKHSFFLFQEVRKNPDGTIKHGFVRNYVGIVLESTTFNGLMWLATMAVVVLALNLENENDSQGMSVFFRVANVYCFVMFISEMVMKMISRGAFQYFKSSLNVVDFLNNCVMVVSSLKPDLKVFTQIRIIRLVKFPDIMRSFSKNHSLNMIVDTLYSAPHSILNLILVCAVMLYFFAVIGLQLWLGCFGYCSYDAYPAYQNKNEASTTFPEGCSGMYNVPNVFGTYIFSELSWKSHVDNFDDIFNSFKSCFRVFISSDWQGMLYSSVDATGPNLEGDTGTSQRSIVFFLILAYLSLTLSVMFLSIIYYHFVMTTLRYGRKVVSGSSNAMWQRVEERLVNASTSFADVRIWDSWEPPKKSHLRHFIWRACRGKRYRYLVASYSIMPMILLIGAYEQTYAKAAFVFYDICFSLAYLIEYSMRVWAIREHAFAGSLGRQEVLVNCAIIVCVVYLMPYAIEPHAHPEVTPTSRLCVYLCVVLRFFRLFLTADSFSTVSRSLRLAMPGVIPTFGYYLTLILIYAVLGVMALGHLDTNYGVSFLSAHYNFRSYQNAIITLMAIGTGNVYSEVSAKLKDNVSPAMRVFIEGFFITFYVFSTVIMKSFAPMIISKYLACIGSTSGLAGQQLRQFQEAWQATAGDDDKITTIKLKHLIETLPEPLGLKGKANKIVNIEIFVRKVLLCMPAAVNHFNDFDENSKRQMYEDTTLPENIWDDSIRMSFRQCIISLHKRALLQNSMPHSSSKVSRTQGIDWLYSLRQQLCRILAEDSIPVEEKNAGQFDNILAYKTLLMMQRMEPDSYRELFLTVILHRLEVIQTRVSSFGFDKFSGWVLSKVRATLRVEERAARLRYEVAKRVGAAMYDQDVAKHKRSISSHYHKQVLVLLETCNTLYNTHVQQIWEANTVSVVRDFRHTQAVTSVWLDESSNIYAAFGKAIRIYKNQANVPEVSATSKYLLMQSLDGFEENVRAVVASPDGKRLFAAVGCDIHCFFLAKIGKTTKVAQYRRSEKTLALHTDVINAMSKGYILESRCMVSGGEDCKIILWDLSKNCPVMQYRARSAVYSLQIVSLKPPSGVPVEEAPVTQIVVAGCKDGSVVVLPLPLKIKSQAAHVNTWEGIVLGAIGKHAPVSSIIMAWNFLYAGGSDGSIRIWAVSTNIVDESRAEVSLGAADINSPLKTFSFQKYIDFAYIDCKYVHIGAVTGLTFAGEVLFSCSHDYSLMPFLEPANMHAKTRLAFKQELGTGMVLHTDGITCMSANKFALVTGDKSGRLKISAPKAMHEVLQSEDISSVKSLVRFSFLSYDFKLVWCSHQSVSPESECILSITNDSFKPVKIRCLHSIAQNPNFRVEPANVENHAITVVLDQKSKNIYEIGPKDRLIYRISFLPAEEAAYSCNIGFMVNETDLIFVRCYGKGVLPKLAVQNNMELFDFGMVNVGSSKLVTIDVTNKTNKEVDVCLVEHSDVLINAETLREEMLSLCQRHITITPRMFRLTSQQTIRLHVRFSPQEALNTFETPIIFALAGAKYALTKLRMRSAKPRSEIMHSLNLRPGGNEQEGKLIEETSTDRKSKKETRADGLKGKNSLSEIEMPGSNLSTPSKSLKHIVSFKEQPKYLRCLGENENICARDHIAPLLRTFGWEAVQEEKFLFLVHKPSGVFLEIPEYCEEQLSNQCHPVDTVKLELTNGDESVYYELWHLNDLIAKGFAEANEEIALCINCDKLKAESYLNVDGRMEECKVDSVGLITLQFQLFKRGSSEMNPIGQVPTKVLGPTASVEERKKYGFLISTAFIRLYKGFRVVRMGAGKELSFLDRLAVGGIERVLTYSESGLVSMNEQFGDHFDQRGVLSNEGNAAFAPIQVTIDSATIEDVITHFRVTSVINEFDGTAGHKSSFMHDINSTNGVENVEIPRPPSKEQNEYGVSRYIQISTESAHVVRGKLQNEVVSDVVSLCAHTARGLASRARASHVSPKSLLPLDVFSDRYAYEISVQNELFGSQSLHSFDNNSELINTMRIATILDKVMLGNHHTTSSEFKETHLFSEQWFFINDCHELHLVSTEVQSLGKFHRNQESNGVHEHAANASSAAPEVSSKPCTDIRFTCRGFSALIEDKTGLQCDNGYIVPVHNPKVEFMSAIKHHQTISSSSGNKEGRSSSVKASPYMLAVWDKRKRQELQVKVKNSLARLFYDKQLKLLTEKQTEAAEMLNEFELKMEAELSRSRQAELNSAQIKEKTRVFALVEQLRNSVSLATTPTAIFNEIVNAVSAFEKGQMKSVLGALFIGEIHAANAQAFSGSGDGRLMFQSFAYYLRSTKLPGFDDVMSKADVDCSIRSLSNELIPGVGCVVARDSFISWYVETENHGTVDIFTHKTLFAVLLREHMEESFRHANLHKSTDADISEATRRKIQSSLSRLSKAILSPTWAKTIRGKNMNRDKMAKVKSANTIWNNLAHNRKLQNASWIEDLQSDGLLNTVTSSPSKRGKARIENESNATTKRLPLAAGGADIFSQTATAQVEDVLLMPNDDMDAEDFASESRSSSDASESDEDTSGSSGESKK